MTLTSLAITDPEGFLQLVARMRKLGVVKLGALVLGPEPREHATTEKPKAAPNAEAFRKHQVMFAASRISPPFVPPVPTDANSPRAIVQRRARDEAAGGTQKSRV